MSRNCGDRECACGLWSFQTDYFVAVGDPSLMSVEEYFASIDWLDCPYRGEVGEEGHGYDDHNVGNFYMYYAPRTDGLVVEEGDERYWLRGCSTLRGGIYQEPRLTGRYLPTPPEERYRFRKLSCPLCRRLYVGWYRRDPVNILILHYEWADQPGYRLYDLSYYHAFNDEPCDRDLAELREWSPEKLAAVAAAVNDGGPAPEFETLGDRVCRIKREGKR